MRVLRVSHSAVVDEWRGRERALTALGVDVELCCARRWHAGGAEVALQPRGAERVRGVRTFGRHPALFLYDPLPLWGALGGEFDVIDVHEEPFALATAEILLLRTLRQRSRRTPVVVYTAQNLRKRYPIPFRWLERWALRTASGVSACNTEAARIAEDKGFVGRARVIPLGVDLERFRGADAPGQSDAVPPEPLDPADPITVGFIGRLVPEKGLLVLLDALAREPRLRLRVVGTGPLASELLSRAASVGVEGRVELTGAVDPAGIPEVLRSFDVLAVPSLPTRSWTEQFGRVAVEAMACGVPVVSSDAGALPDVVGGAGLVVPAGDAGALAEALVEASGPRAVGLRAAGFARAEECSWNAVGRDYLDLYRSIVHEAFVASEPSPTLEVIVVAYGSPELLRRALLPVAGLPVTVVDNSSLPAIRELCDELGVRYLDPGRNGGFAAGVNHGLAHRIVPGADVLLLNPDAEISADDVARLHRALRARPDLASVGPAQVDDDGREARVEWWLPSPSGTWLEALGLARLRRDPSYVIGSVMLLRAEALEQVGWFDERYFLYAEEADWAYRAYRLGWRHAVVPEARAVHVGAGTGGDPRRREAHFHASQERFLRKHFGAAGWQVARAGQWLGAMARSIVLPGERGRGARRRAALYRLGPVRVEARFRRSDAAGSERDAVVRRVALVTSSYAPHFGGVEEHVRQVAHELSQRADTEVEVWTVDRGEHLGTRDVDGVVVRYLPTPLPARNLRSTLALLRDAPAAWLAWSRARRSFRPDLLHIHCFGPNGVYALVLGRFWRLPIAVTSHGETSADDRGAFARSALLRRALRAAIARARFVTAPSEWVLDELRTSYGLVGGGVVPNGVAATVGRPDPAHRITALDDPRAYIAAVGRLGPLKGFDLLLDAFADAGLPDDTRLLIGGDGPERDSIERRITDLGLGGRAELLGRLDAAQVDDVMRRSIAVAVPSRLEPFGIVALEAWRARAALIMTNRGGGPEFVHDGVDGLLVDPLDRDALSRALRRIHDDAELRTRLADTGHARVPEFSWPGVAAAYRARYDLG